MSDFDHPIPTRDPNITDEPAKLKFTASRTIATPEQASVIEKVTGEPSQPLTPLWEQHWPSFAVALCEKLARGHREYGDGSFNRPTNDIIEEILEELLDVSGWSMMQWVRLTQLQARIEQERCKRLGCNNIIIAEPDDAA